jgi:hypothetical protein
MMEAVRTSETSVDNHFTRQYNPEDSSEHQIWRLLIDPVPMLHEDNSLTWKEPDHMKEQIMYIACSNCITSPNIMQICMSIYESCQHIYCEISASCLSDF